MDRLSEAQFERKAEAMLAGHRQAPPGRDYRAFAERYRTDVNNTEFDQRFDETFPAATGSPEWWDKKFGKANA